jgi:DNA-binding TFAR19-related protein (PDSD5 family)
MVIMALEKFNRSRAQEAHARLQNMRLEYESLAESIEEAQIELRQRCPHPDEFVVKLDEIRPSRQNKLFKSHELWLCKLCGITKMKED